ncbi:MAG: homocysteine S-methyltransferase family protein, partial [Oscillospiraceae bacterium]
FEECINTAPLILAEASTSSRMCSKFGYSLDKFVGNGAWIYDDKLRGKYAEVYRAYFRIAEKLQLPIMTTSATRWAHRGFIEKSGYSQYDIASDNITFVREIAKSFDTPVYVNYIEGCRGSQYDASCGAKITVDAARNYHREQLDSWRRSDPDYLYSGIMPEINESIGMAQAFSESGLPYTIAFLVTDSGCMLDGTPLCDAVSRVDEETDTPPLFYMANCVHPVNLLHALQKPFNQTEKVRRRIRGSVSNASMLKPNQLEGCDHIKNSDAKELADAVVKLNDYHPMQICGGCCGTDETHLFEIASRLKALRM